MNSCCVGRLSFMQMFWDPWRRYSKVQLIAVPSKERKCIIVIVCVTPLLLHCTVCRKRFCGFKSAAGYSNESADETISVYVHSAEYFMMLAETIDSTIPTFLSRVFVPDMTNRLHADANVCWCKCSLDGVRVNRYTDTAQGRHGVIMPS